MSVRLRCNQLYLFVARTNKLRPQFLGLLILGMLGIGQPTCANDAVEQLRSFTKNTKSASGDFLQQQVSLSSGSDVKPRVIRQQQGTFVFSRPGRFSWNTLKPFEQVMIADGKQLMMWDKDLNQVTYRKANLALAASPAAILFGNTALEEYFELNSITTKNFTVFIMYKLDKRMIMILNKSNKWIEAEPEDQREIASSKEAKEYLNMKQEDYNRSVGFIGYEKSI